MQVMLMRQGGQQPFARLLWKRVVQAWGYRGRCRRASQCVGGNGLSKFLQKKRRVRKAPRYQGKNALHQATCSPVLSNSTITLFPSGHLLTCTV